MAGSRYLLIAERGLEYMRIYVEGVAEAHARALEYRAMGWTVTFEPGDK